MEQIRLNREKELGWSLWDFFICFKIIFLLIVSLLYILVSVFWLYIWMHLTIIGF